MLLQQFLDFALIELELLGGALALQFEAAFGGVGFFWLSAMADGDISAVLLLLVALLLALVFALLGVVQHRLPVVVVLVFFGVAAKWVLQRLGVSLHKRRLNFPWRPAVSRLREHGRARGCWLLHGSASLAVEERHPLRCFLAKDCPPDFFLAIVLHTTRRPCSLQVRQLEWRHLRLSCWLARFRRGCEWRGWHVSLGVEGDHLLFFFHP